MKIVNLTEIKGFSLPLLRNLKTNEVLDVARKKVIIGRHSGDDMTINDPKCSRGNTEVEFIDGKYFVRDRGSRNGTSLNGVPIKESVPINFGDKILIGATEIEFQKTPEKINIEITGYEILEHTASGGMGKVYKAKQISLDRVVAIKVLAAKFTNNPRLTENFINEARAAGRLNHPNLVQVHDVNKDFQKNGQVIYYFTMEFIDGKTLKEMIRDVEKLPVLQVLDLLIDITRGLEYIHANKLIHRDIKPDNIMIDHDGNLKIADLGIALDANEVETNEPTEDGQRRIVGTPHYISPEQVRGKGIDARSDIYSLGATTFHMLTGETPFEGNSSKEIIKKHVVEEARLVSDLNPDVPPIVCDLVKRMMSKKQEERPQSVALLREDIEQIKIKLEKGKSRTKLSKNKSRSANYIIQFSAVIIGLTIAGAYLYFVEMRSDPTSDNTTNSLPIEQTGAAIQAKIQQAQELSNNRDYQKALDIYNSLRKENLEPKIITDIDALIKKTNIDFEKSKKQQALEDINLKYSEILTFKTQNLTDLNKVITKYEEFIKRFPSTQESRSAQIEVNRMRNDQIRLEEIKRLEDFKRRVESIPNEEEKLDIINANKKSFMQIESKTWLDEKTVEINTKFEEIVSRATKDAQSLDVNIAAEEYDLALSRAQSALNNYTYPRAKNVISAKIKEIENKTNILKENAIKECQEYLKVLNYHELNINIFSKLNKIKKSKAYEEILEFTKNVEGCQDLHDKVQKILTEGKTPIQVNWSGEVDGMFDITSYKVIAFDKKAISFQFKSSKEKEEQQKIITWPKFEKVKLYLVYESILIANNKLEEFKDQMSGFIKVHNISDKDLEIRDN